MYERKNSIMILLTIEALLIAFVIGTLKNSFLLGIITFVGVGILYGIPIISQTLGCMSSFTEAYIVFELIKNIEFIKTSEAVVISTIIFLVLIYLHNRTVEMEDLRFVGFGWLLFEAVTVSIFFYDYVKDSFLLSLAVLFLLIILAITPFVRVIEFIGLSAFAGYFTYSLFFSLVEKKYALISGTIIFIYSVVMYVYVYKSLDYIGMKKRSEQRKKDIEHYAEYSAIKKSIYDKFPEAEKEYYYFYTSVCVNEAERNEFDTDWEDYIFYLNKNNYVQFNIFFESRKLYRYRFYNRDYAKNHNNTENQGNTAESFDENFNKNLVYFKGVNSSEGLKKRYRELLKIYHTDNPYGDNEVCQIIQKEYEYLTNKFKE